MGIAGCVNEKLTYQHHYPEGILVIGNIQSPLITVHYIFYRRNSNPVELFILFVREIPAFLYSDLIFLGILQLKTEIAVFRITAFQPQPAAIRIIYLAAGFNGVVQGIGKYGTKAYVVQKNHIINTDVKKAVDRGLRHLLVFGIQYSVLISEAIFSKYSFAFGIFSS